MHGIVVRQIYIALSCCRTRPLFALESLCFATLPERRNYGSCLQARRPAPCCRPHSTPRSRRPCLSSRRARQDCSTVPKWLRGRIRGARHEGGRPPHSSPRCAQIPGARSTKCPRGTPSSGVCMRACWTVPDSRAMPWPKIGQKALAAARVSSR